MPKIPYVLINPFFTNVDQNKVSNKIRELKEAKRKDLFKKNIETIMNDQLFEIVHSVQNKEETLTLLCESFVEKEFVDSSFLTNVKEREAMSSTAFGRIAIPHAIKMNAKKTGMYALINSKGIVWDDLTVKLVLLLFVNKDDKRIYHDVFDSLATILTEDGNVSQIVSATDYQSFVDLLVACYH